MTKQEIENKYNVQIDENRSAYQSKKIGYTVYCLSTNRELYKATTLKEIELHLKNGYNNENKDEMSIEEFEEYIKNNLNKFVKHWKQHNSVDPNGWPSKLPGLAEWLEHFEMYGETKRR